MKRNEFDRTKLDVKPLAVRENKIEIEKAALTPETYANVETDYQNYIDETVSRIRKAKSAGKPVALACGAHTIKNALAPVLIRLMEKGFVDHLATNGAGIIHDWEFAFQGKSSEDVRKNVERGQFGIWDETGFYINLAIIAGVYEGLSYGAAVGKMIEEEALTIPEEAALVEEIKENASSNPSQAAAAADFLDTIQMFSLKAGKMEIPHPYKQYSVQAAAYRLGIPFTGHPMFGHDIIYTHPMNKGAAIGRAAERDFLSYANTISKIDGGVYLSVGSAVMSPMIFEKSLSMSQNIAIQNGTHIDDHFIVVVDLAESTWDWANDGEPPMENPAYFLRYAKSFNRMGGTMRYVSMDNRDFLIALTRALES